MSFFGIHGVSGEEEKVVGVEQQGFRVQATKLIRWPKLGNMWGWIFYRRKVSNSVP